MNKKNVTLNVNCKPITPNRDNIPFYTQFGLERWIPSHFSEFGRERDLIRLRILGFLFENNFQTRGHTRGQIARTLNVWEDLIVDKLKMLKKQGYIYEEYVSFGMDHFGKQRRFPIYQMTELGRFLLHQMDTQFPGLWITNNEETSLII